MVQNTLHTGVRAVSIPLPPARRPFLMVDTGTLYFRTLHLGRLSNCYLSTPPIQPYLQLNYTPSTHQLHTATSACSLSPFCGFCWLLLLSLGATFLLHQYPTLSPRGSSIHLLRMSSSLSPSPVSFFTLPSAHHMRRSCVFGCVLNTFG